MIKPFIKMLKAKTYLGIFLSFLDCMLIKFMQFSCIKLRKFWNKYPKISVMIKSILNSCQLKILIQNKINSVFIKCIKRSFPVQALRKAVIANYTDLRHCLMCSRLVYSFRQSVMWSPILIRHCRVCSSCSRSERPFSGRSSCFKAAFTGRIRSLHC